MLNIFAADMPSLFGLNFVCVLGFQLGIFLLVSEFASLFLIYTYEELASYVILWLFFVLQVNFCCGAAGVEGS